jgi:hypothetical protein
MPRVQKEIHKYRCMEPACGNIVRSDKWSDHCRCKHLFKFSRFVFVLTAFGCYMALFELARISSYKYNVVSIVVALSVLVYFSLHARFSLVYSLHYLVIVFVEH